MLRHLSCDPHTFAYRSGLVSCHFIDSEDDKIVIYTQSAAAVWDIVRQNGVESEEDFEINESRPDVKFL